MDNKSADENGATPKIRFSVLNDPRKWDVDAVILNCATNEDAKQAEVLFNGLLSELTASQARVGGLERGIRQQKEDFASSMRGFIKLKSESDAELTALRAENAELTAKHQTTLAAGIDGLSELEARRKFQVQELRDKIAELRADNTRLVANALSLESEIEELRGRLEVANLTYLGAASERDELKGGIERHVQIANECRRDAERIDWLESTAEAEHGWRVDETGAPIMRGELEALWSKTLRAAIDYAQSENRRFNSDTAISPEERSGKERRSNGLHAQHWHLGHVDRRMWRPCRRITAGTRADRREK